MKKVLFCLQSMILGGVEKELLELLNKISCNYDITLALLFIDDKEILCNVPNNVKLKIVGIDKEYYYGNILRIFLHRIRRGKFLEGTSIAIKRLLKIGMTLANTNLNYIPSFDDIYDVAICYHIHAPLLVKYVAEKVQAKKKVAWIHSDFYTSGYPIHKLKKYIISYNEIVSVSKKVEHEFRVFCPWYVGDVSTAHNYLNEEEIIKSSNNSNLESIFSNESSVKILTIGRFSNEKGIDIAIKTAYYLKKKNLRFHWFLIGHGPQENTYLKLIKKYYVSDCFTILGRKDNPYPYIKNCDIYVQPSRHEAFGLVILEAKILKKPIVCTNFAGADEQIINGQNGIIVPINDIESLSENLSNLISSPQQWKVFSESLENFNQEDNLKEIVRHLDD